MSLNLHPHFTPFHSSNSHPQDQESPNIQSLIETLSLTPHPEGGYYIETDRSPLTIPSPFPPDSPSTTPPRPDFNPSFRSLSTTIFYLLTPSSPQGGFHRNLSRITHTLHRGRGMYVIIHADEPGELKRVERFVVGADVEKGERLQWVVEGGKFKGSFLLPDNADDVDEGEGKGSDGLLISEVVTPGFEICDHDFLSEEGLEGLVGKERRGELEWLLSPEGRK